LGRNSRVQIPALPIANLRLGGQVEYLVATDNRFGPTDFPPISIFRPLQLTTKRRRRNYFLCGRAEEAPDSLLTGVAISTVEKRDVTVAVAVGIFYICCLNNNNRILDFATCISCTVRKIVDLYRFNKSQPSPSANNIGICRFISRFIMPLYLRGLRLFLHGFWNAARN
jgi:hypothetical protein